MINNDTTNTHYGPAGLWKNLTSSTYSDQNSMLSHRNFNFNYICNFDVTNVVEIVKTFNDEWYHDTSRQELFKKHTNTTSIFVTKFPLDWKGDGYPYEICNYPDKIAQAIKPIIIFLENHFEGKNGRTLLAKLTAHGHIPAHRDGGYYLQGVHRCHIPITTNELVEFEINGEAINMKAGECYEINNKITHAVKNNGNMDRVHLIIDIIPDKLFLST